MGTQLPVDARGAAAAILAFSILCLTTSLLLIWLVWVQNERRSYVALLGAILSLSVLASILQQIHTIARWNDIKTAQWQNVVENVGNPELNITGASTGLDLVLFYIQYYTYNVESMLILFWATELAHSVFQIRSSRASRMHASLIAKTVAILLPAVQQICLRQPIFQQSTIGYMVLADFIMIFCFAGGAILLIAILGKYIHARLSLVVSWKVRYGQQSERETNSTGTQSSAPALARRPSIATPRQQKSIYDRWLLLRFTIAFIALGLFELVVINFQLRASKTNTAANIPPSPDLSAGRAMGDFTLYVPGVSGAPLTFLVFGTTRTFRDYMAKTFLPRSWYQRLESRRHRRQKPSTAASVGAQRGVVSSGKNGNNINHGVDIEAAIGAAGAIRMQEFVRAKQESDKWREVRTSQDYDRSDDEIPIIIMKPLPPPPRSYSP